MSNLITNEILTYWTAGRKTKKTPSGWISGNAPCCSYNGQSLDTRNRGGLLLNEQGGFNWHCFNCNFKAGWIPGKLLTKNTRNLFKWLGIAESEIDKLALVALQLKDNTNTSFETPKITTELQQRQLPELTLPLLEWVDQDLPDELSQPIIKVVEYLIDQRAMKLDWYPWHYSFSPSYRDRIIIPFYYKEKIVGWTARKITDGKPKYLTDSQNGYVFNLDNQTHNKKYLIVVEGPFDAIAIDGVAILHNEPNEIQATRINALNKQIIVVPDRDQAGVKLIDTALEYGWHVSFPPWNDNVKDVADAVKHYGRLYTLNSILEHTESNKIKIELLKKKIEQKYE